MEFPKLFWRGKRDSLLKFCRTSSGTEGRFKSQCGGELLLPLGRTKGLMAVHTGAEGGEFMGNEWLINPRRSFLRQRNRGGIREMGQT